MENNIIALDLGTSKFALLAAKVLGDNVQVEYYREVPAAGMKYGKIFNTREAGRALEPLINDAQDKLGYKIKSVVAGLPKFPVSSALGESEILDRQENTEIEEEEINELKRFAKDTYDLGSDNRQIFDAIAQSFDTDYEFQVMEDEIVGITSSRVKGNFKLFIGAKSDYNNIDNLLRKFGISAIRKYFTPVGIGRITLRLSEAKSGVALVDFGAGCTSVSIFKDKVLRFFGSIPFGAQTITNDIEKECSINSNIAENIKLAYGACMPEKLQNMRNKTLNIIGQDHNKAVSMKYLSEIITAREEEIIMAVLYMIYKSGLADNVSTIVGTGGGANLTNLGLLITKISGCQFRIGRPNVQYATPDNELISYTTAAGAIGLLKMAMEEGDVSCNTEFIGTKPVETESTEAADEGTQTEIFSEGNTFEVVDNTGEDKKQGGRKNSDPKPKKPRRNIFSKLMEGAGNLFDTAFYNVTEEEDNNK